MYMKKLTQQVDCGTNSNIVETVYGKIRGIRYDTTYIFRGVPYATARRFHLPEPLTPWEGVKDALAYGYVCPDINTPVSADDAYVPHNYYPMDEHCQNLNVWTQSLNRNAKKPVIVWLHGGGWGSGSSIDLFAYDGENLSKFGDVVVVSVNHRLNSLGFINLSEFTDEFAGSENAGLADMVAALQWIHDNIEAFGGDPGNVTIFGQSGGGDKVLSLMQTPAADGLYHKAIVDSGVMKPFPAPASTEEIDKNFARLVVKYLGLTKENILDIEKIDIAVFYDAVAKAIWESNQTIGSHIQPFPDGKYYMGNPFEVGFREENKAVPLMIGSVLSEFTHNLNNAPDPSCHKNQWTEAHTIDLIRQQFGDKTDAVIAAFKKAYPGRNIADILFVETMTRTSSTELCSIRSETGGAPVYNWLFTYEFPFKNGTLPWHCSELAFAFHNADCLEASYEPGVTETLQDIIAGAWVSFARTGNPNHAGMPAWQAVEGSNVATMLFDRECRCVVNHDTDLMALLPAMRVKFPMPDVPIYAMVGLAPDNE